MGTKRSWQLVAHLGGKPDEVWGTYSTKKRAEQGRKELRKEHPSFEKYRGKLRIKRRKK